MTDQEIKDIIQASVKSPKDDFTNNVMNEIHALNDDVKVIQKRKFWILLIVSAVIMLLSIFIKIPVIDFYSLTLNLSHVMMPVIGLLFGVVILQQSYDYYFLQAGRVK